MLVYAAEYILEYFEPYAPGQLSADERELRSKARTSLADDASRPETLQAAR